MMVGQDDSHVTFDRPAVVDEEDDDEGDGRCSCCRRDEESRKCECSPTTGCIQSLVLLGALAAGIGVGVALRYVSPFNDIQTVSRRYLMYLYLPAEFVLRLVHFMSVPFIIMSVLSGIGGLTLSISTRIFFRSFFFFVVTSVLAAAQGLGLVYAIQPARYGRSTQGTGSPYHHISDTTIIDVFLDMLRNLFPNNFLTAGLEMTTTRLDFETVALENNDTFIHETRWLEKAPGSNVLGILFFATLFGFGTAAMGHRRRPLVVIVDLFFSVIHSTYKGLVWLYPIMVFFMMLVAVVTIHQPISYLQSMFVILLTILLGLFIHAMFILPLIYLVFARRNPYKILWGSLRALFTALITNDSLTTLPVTIDCMERLHMHPRSVRYLCPMGAMVNLDGFIIQQTISIIFLADRAGVTPTPLQFVVLGFLAVGVSFLAPVGSKNMALLMTMTKLLDVSTLDVAVLFPFLWAIERFSTVADVWSDCVAVGVVQSTSQDELLEVSNPTSLINGGVIQEDGARDMDDNGPMSEYGQPGSRDWTVRLVNEEGDRLVVSKV